MAHYEAGSAIWIVFAFGVPKGPLVIMRRRPAVGFIAL
jgi:hypothetical protein